MSTVQKEKTKKIWQFVILLALPVLILIGIFFSYYKSPGNLNPYQMEMIKRSEEFNQVTGSIKEKLLMLDSNLNLLANNTSNLGLSQIRTQIELNNEEMIKLDSSRLTKTLYTMVNNHLNHLVELNKVNKEFENAGSLTP
jgi:hypothetical protein